MTRDQFLNTRQVSRATGWSMEKVRQLIRTGKLPAIDTSTGERARWSIRVDDLERFLTPSEKAAS